MKERERQVEIMVLTNAVYYNLNWVFILNEIDREGFRLIAIKNNVIHIDQDYPTLRGAKISCAKAIQSRGFKGRLRTRWSSFFEPEEGWLLDKLTKAHYVVTL